MSLLVDGRGMALVRGGRFLFEGLDIALGQGEGLHLIGPNGVGKSSVIRLLAGLLPLATGSLERVDAALADDALALDRELPLGTALAFWNGRKLAEAINAFGLERLADTPVRLLSTGQRKRATLARVMASDAPLWLLDEPLNGLDRDGVERLAGALDVHRRAGGAVIIASHAALVGEWRVVELGA